MHFKVANDILPRYYKNFSSSILIKTVLNLSDSEQLFASRKYGEQI